MTTAATIAARLSLDGSDFYKGLDDAAKGSDSFSARLGSLGTSLAGVGVAMAAVGAAAVAMAGVGLGLVIKEAMEAETNNAKLEQVLRATGGAAGVTEQAAKDLAWSLRDLAGGSDDAVLAAETVLLRFQEISAENFPAATLASLNLAAVMDTDAASAARALGRALEDPGTGLRVLAQAGVVFTDEQKKVMDAMMKAGDIAGAQKYILDALAETTGGAAAAAANTFGGQMDIMKGHLLEVAEGIGNKLLPLFKDGLAWIMPIVEEAASQLSASFTMLLPHVLALADKIGGLVEQVLGLFGIDVSKFDLQVVILQATGYLSDFIAGISAFVDLVSANLPAIVAYFQPLIDAVRALAASFTSSLPQIESTVSGMGATVVQVFGQLGPTIIGNVAGALNTLTAIWNEHGTTILAIITVAWNAIVLTVGGALTLVSGAVESALIGIQGILHAVSLAMSGDWQGAWDAIVGAEINANLNMMSAINTFFESIASKMGTSMGEIRATWQADWNLLLTILSQIWTNIQAAIVGKLTEIRLSILTGINDAIEGVKSTLGQWIALGEEIVNNIRIGISMYIAGMIADVVKGVTDALAAAGAALGLGIPTSQYPGIPGIPAPVSGSASGADFVVPPGYPNDSYPMRVETGEHVTVTPAGQSAPTGGNTINLYAANDVDYMLLARQVAQILAVG